MDDWYSVFNLHTHETHELGGFEREMKMWEHFVGVVKPVKGTLESPDVDWFLNYFSHQSLVLGVEPM